jgi:hypothetical protein
MHRDVRWYFCKRSTLLLDFSSTDVNSLVPCSYTAAMPQLTPECDRVVLFGLQTSDVRDFDVLDYCRLIQMTLEIRICEDYCLSDIYIVDLGKYTLGHITKITLPMIKNQNYVQ